MVKRKSKPNRDYDDDYSYYGYYPPSRPIQVEGGIKSRSQRGTFAANWWAKRWLSVLESYGIGSRLQRGRSYARSGQVLKIDIQPGLVTAQVQGSRSRPYAVKIQVSQLIDTDWQHVLDVISERAIFTAQLLNGEMPHEIETAFEAAKVSLFPTNTRDVITNCSCPDYSNPCKHIAAVYYLLGEQFDIDPFLIFALRGRTREEVIEALRKRRSAVVREAGADEMPVETLPPTPPLNEQITDFWGADSFDWTPPPIAAPEIDCTVFKRLGWPPEDMKKQLEIIYQAMTTYAEAKIIGSDEDFPEE